MKNGCKEFISKAMDSINNIHHFDNRLHDIIFTQTTLRIALKRGHCIEETMQLLDDLRDYIVYLYEHIEQLEKDKQYLLRGKLNLKYQGGKMDNYIACEQAYKNGYEQGKKDALQNQKCKAISDKNMEFKKEFTVRGFAIDYFYDDYDEKCSLQESSSVKPHIWLGIDKAKPIVLCSDASKVGVERKANNGWQDYEVPKEVFINTRMHLTKKQSLKLALKLLKFALFGKI